MGREKRTHIRGKFRCIPRELYEFHSGQSSLYQSIGAAVGRIDGKGFFITKKKLLDEGGSCTSL